MFKWFKKVQPEVGMKLRNKDGWPGYETIVEVTAVSPDKKYVMIAHRVIDGAKMSHTHSSSKYTWSCVLGILKYEVISV